MPGLMLVRQDRLQCLQEKVTFGVNITAVLSFLLCFFLPYGGPEKLQVNAALPMICRLVLRSSARADHSEWLIGRALMCFVNESLYRFFCTPLFLCPYTPFQEKLLLEKTLAGKY